ncbi:MAG: adenylate/guanylate cyclase domain-containing protein [Polyangiaceae bacterium]|nr:adenylate/guanylate cyclase domain-containing protein [Polyangiaceae bacterium]
MHPRELGRALERRVLAIFAVSSLISIIVGLVFFISGLDFTAHQRRLVFFAIAPLATLFMVLVEVIAVRRLVRPIRAYLDSIDRPGEPAPGENAARALVRLLNLPLFSTIRVLAVHAPAFGIPTTLLVIVANRYLYLNLEDWQFLLMWATMLIFTAAHAIYEYFAVAAAVRPMIPVMKRYAGELPPEAAARIIPLNTKRKLLFVFSFVALVPAFALGATVLIKVHRMLFILGVRDPLLFMAPLEAWVGLLFGSSCGVTLVMAALLAREVSSATTSLVRAMKRVERGELDVHLDVTSTDEFADLYEGFNRMSKGLLERERLHDAFGRYVGQAIAEDIMRRGVSMGGATVNAAVLFADIRGFTEMSERMKPAEVVGLLNRYTAAMEPAILEAGGFINKFGGDSLLAIFGAPVPQPDHAERAVRAALGMREGLAAFNAREKAEGRRELRIGVGVSCGEMVAGSVGTPNRMEYTVIGDVVNVAARIQALNKELGTDILVSAEVYERVKDRVKARAMPPASVQGKSAPLHVYAIEGEERKA